MEMMLDKKQIRAIFLFKFKMGHKTVETTCDINSAFGPGTANKGKVQWWFKKFCKADKSLENEEHSGQPSQVDNNQLRAIIKADPLTTTWELARKLNVNHSRVIQHLKQIGKVKSSISGCLMSWPRIKKSLFWSVIFSYSMQQQAISLADYCDMWWKVDFIWQLEMTSSVVRPIRSSKALCKAKLEPKESPGRCLVVSWPSDPLQLSESWWNH